MDTEKIKVTATKENLCGAFQIESIAHPLGCYMRSKQKGASAILYINFKF